MTPDLHTPAVVSPRTVALFILRAVAALACIGAALFFVAVAIAKVHAFGGFGWPEAAVSMFGACGFAWAAGRIACGGEG